MLPPGVVNVVNGIGEEAGNALGTSGRIAKLGFTGECATGNIIMQYGSRYLIPITLELGGKSPNIFCSDIFNEDDEFLDKCVEGFVMFALNQGEVCTCPSRALIHESVYEKFMQRCIERTKAIKRAHPLNKDAMIGAQVSQEQFKKILNYIEIGKIEGAELLIGGAVDKVEGCEDGFYIQPTIFKGHNKMRVF